MSATTSTADLIDRLTSEGLIPLAEAARRLGSTRRTRPVHPSTVNRWVMHGRRLKGGRTVRLEAVRSGGQWLTSWPAVRRYLAAQTEAAAPPAAGRTPTQRRRDAEDAERELERAGV
ncbi:MAG TPA: DUF1580 domain-containing protein [Fimbriiglobus sp.]|nr:DUF1580 domain-containing protein [Fimbriiglobus sp.]